MKREHNLERQMGCMAGFLHIFDGHHLLAGKRLPPSTTPPLTYSSPEPHNHGGSPAGSSSPEPVLTQSPTPTTPLQLPVLELKEGTRTQWKFSRDTPRLSLDSRAIVDAKGTLHPRPRHVPTNNSNLPEKQRRSTSVVARLMGLDEPIPDSDPELRRSASESRASGDLPKYRFFDANNFQFKQLHNPNNDDDARLSKAKTEAPFRVRRGKKSFYDWGDFFPEPKKSVSMYGEIERRLKMRGIDEPSKNLHALKEILEALQLKGLLHSNKSVNLPTNQSPIVVMKPNRNHSPPPPSTTSPRARNSNSPCSVRSPNRMRKTMVNAEKVAPVYSRRIEPPVQQVTSRSPRIRKPTYQKEEKIESHTASLQKFKTEENKEGRSLLERCDKLLNSIAEMTSATTELQPSPVSVLDSSFYKDESSCSPSPVMKRCVDYKGKIADVAADSEDDMWSGGGLCCREAKSEETEDFVYVSEIVRACNYFREDRNLFLLLEKQQYLKGDDTSKTSTLRRRLIFDTIHEIINRHQRLPPWKAVSLEENKLDRIWSEFRRIREREEGSEELFEVICGVLRKDMAEDSINECPVEMGDVVLDMERLVFKDLIGETIRELASFKGPHCNRVSTLRRKLMF